jgi:hypothetical protein
MSEQLSEDYITLCENQYSRLETYNTYKDFIDNLENGKKQKNYRKYLKNVLTFISQAKKNNYLTRDYTLDDLLNKRVLPIFENSNDEYFAINKFGCGLWDEHYIRSGFSAEEQNNIINIAKGYGAFYY